MLDQAINKFCPSSGKPIESNSLTKYKGHVVGFCNPSCRDDFASDPSICVNDRVYFDAVIKENGLSEN